MSKKKTEKKDERKTTTTVAKTLSNRTTSTSVNKPTPSTPPASTQFTTSSYPSVIRETEKATQRRTAAMIGGLGNASRGTTNRNPEAERRSSQPRGGQQSSGSRGVKSLDELLKKQREINRATQKENTRNANPNIRTPFYNQIIRYDKDGRANVEVTLSDPVKRAFDQFYSGVSGLGELRDRLLDRAGAVSSDINDLRSQAYQPETSFTPREIDIDLPTLSYNFSPERFQSQFTEKDFTNRFTPEQFQVTLQEQNWDLNLTPEEIDYAGTVADRKTVEDELFNLYSQDIERNYNRRRQELETEMLNQGLSPFSSRFREKLEDLEREKNRAINEARQRAVADSSSEMLKRLRGQLDVAQTKFGQRKSIQELARQRALDLFAQRQNIEAMKQKAFEDYQNNRISAQQLQNQLTQLQIQDDEIRNRINLEAHNAYQRMQAEAEQQRLLAQQRNIENQLALEQLKNQTAAQNFQQSFALDELQNRAINEAFTRNLQANQQAIQGALQTQNSISNAIVNPTPSYTASPMPYTSVSDALAAYHSTLPRPFNFQFPPI